MDFYLQKLGFEYPKKSFLLQMKSNTNSIKVFRLLFGKINSFFLSCKVLFELNSGFCIFRLQLFGKVSQA